MPKKTTPNESTQADEATVSPASIDSTAAVTSPVDEAPTPAAAAQPEPLPPPEFDPRTAIAEPVPFRDEVSARTIGYQQPVPDSMAVNLFSVGRSFIRTSTAKLVPPSPPRPAKASPTA